MKSSIGSLAALAAFSLPAATDAAIHVSSFSNVELVFGETVSFFDIDGANGPDFYVWANPYTSDVGLYAERDTLFVSGSLAYGTPIEFGGTTDTFVVAESSFAPSDSIAYFGFSFTTASSDTLLGWIKFDFTDSTFFAVQAAWEDVPLGSIPAGVIPEPASATVLAGTLCLVAATLRRPRREAARPDSTA